MLVSSAEVSALADSMTASEQPLHRSLEKVRPTAAKRISKKKSKDKPKRPLSAYNFFFREEREKILQVLRANDVNAIQPDPDSDDFLSEHQIGRLKKNGDKVSFEEMGKLIGVRWKNIDPGRLNRFSELASQDTDRYKQEMELFNSRQEEKLRNEALKSPMGKSAYASMTSTRGEQHQMGIAQYTAEQQAYAAQMAPQGYAPYNGGMMYSGYSMPMYNYASYVPQVAAMASAEFETMAAQQQPQYAGTYPAGNNAMGYSQTDQQGNIGPAYNQTGEIHGTAHDPSAAGSYYPQYSAWGHQ